VSVLITSGGNLDEQAVAAFNDSNSGDCRPLLHLHFSVQENGLTFAPAQ